MNCRACVHEQTAEGGRIIYLHAPRHYPNCQRWLHCVPTISSSFFFTPSPMLNVLHTSQITNWYRFNKVVSKCIKIVLMQYLVRTDAAGACARKIADIFPGISRVFFFWRYAVSKKNCCTLEVTCFWRFESFQSPLLPSLALIDFFFFFCCDASPPDDITGSQSVTHAVGQRRAQRN